MADAFARESKRPMKATPRFKSNSGPYSLLLLLIPNLAVPLLDEQHLLIRRQRPQVVGNQELELIGGSADGVHGGDDHVTGVLGVGE